MADPAGHWCQGIESGMGQNRWCSAEERFWFPERPKAAAGPTRTRHGGAPRWHGARRAGMAPAFRPAPPRPSEGVCACSVGAVGRGAGSPGILGTCVCDFWPNDEHHAMAVQYQVIRGRGIRHASH